MDVCCVCVVCDELIARPEVLRLRCFVVCDIEISRMRRQRPHFAEGPEGKLIMLIHLHTYLYSLRWNLLCCQELKFCWYPYIMVTDSNTKWLLIPKTVFSWEEVDLLVLTCNPILASKDCDERHRLADLTSRVICRPIKTTSWHLPVHMAIQARTARAPVYCQARYRLVTGTRPASEIRSCCGADYSPPKS